MKKIIAIILALVLALSFVACSKNSDKTTILTQSLQQKQLKQQPR